MSSPISVLEAARALAATAPGKERELNELLLKSFILPGLEALSSLDTTRKAFLAIGAQHFHASAMRMADTKVKKLLEACGCAKAALKSLSGVETRKLLAEFASGARATYEAEAPQPQPKTPPRTGKTTSSRTREPKPVVAKAAAPLPDVRDLYRSGGMEALHKAIKPLKVAELRHLIAEQQLKVPPKAASKKDDMLKHIQTAVRDELGVRGDWIGAVARQKGGPDVS